MSEIRVWELAEKLHAYFKSFEASLDDYSFDSISYIPWSDMTADQKKWWYNCVMNVFVDW